MPALVLLEPLLLYFQPERNPLHYLLFLRRPNSRVGHRCFVTPTCWHISGHTSLCRRLYSSNRSCFTFNLNAIRWITCSSFAGQTRGWVTGASSRPPAGTSPAIPPYAGACTPRTAPALLST